MYLIPEPNNDINCNSCGHYITGGGCHKDDHINFVKVNPDSVCDKHVPKDAEGTINHKQDLHERRFDKDIPFGHLRLEYGDRNDRTEAFKRLIGRNAG